MVCAVLALATSAQAVVLYTENFVGTTAGADLSTTTTGWQGSGWTVDLTYTLSPDYSSDGDNYYVSTQEDSNSKWAVSKAGEYTITVPDLPPFFGPGIMRVHPLQVQR